MEKDDLQSVDQTNQQADREVDTEANGDSSFKREVQFALGQMTPEQRQVVRDLLDDPEFETDAQMGSQPAAEPHGELQAMEAEKMRRADAEIANGRRNLLAAAVTDDASRYVCDNGRWKAYVGVMNGHEQWRWLGDQEVAQLMDEGVIGRKEAKPVAGEDFSRASHHSS